MFGEPPALALAGCERQITNADPNVKAPRLDPDLAPVRYAADMS